MTDGPFELLEEFLVFELMPLKLLWGDGII
jgi:hypothetical protein